MHPWNPYYLCNQITPWLLKIELQSNFCEHSENIKIHKWNDLNFGCNPKCLDNYLDILLDVSLYSRLVLTIWPYILLPNPLWFRNRIFAFFLSAELLSISWIWMNRVYIWAPGREMNLLRLKIPKISVSSIKFSHPHSAKRWQQMVNRQSDVGVRFEATFTDYNTNSSCKT